MGDECCSLRMGARVPDFTIKTFNPAKINFGEFILKEQIRKKKWTVLFFYPADFTFV